MIEFVLDPWQYLKDYLNDENARSNMPDRFDDKDAVQKAGAYFLSVQSE